MATRHEGAVLRMLRSRPALTTAELAGHVAWMRAGIQPFSQRQHSADVLRLLLRLERRGIIARQPATKPILWTKGGQP